MENTKRSSENTIPFYLTEAAFSDDLLFLTLISEETASIALTSQSQPDRDRRSGRRVGGAGGR